MPAGELVLVLGMEPQLRVIVCLQMPAVMHQADKVVNGALQGWADALMAAAGRLPDEEHAQEVAASESASGLLQRAVQAFAQVPSSAIN